MKHIQLLVFALAAISIVTLWKVFPMHTALPIQVDIEQLLKAHVEDTSATGIAVGFIENGKISYYTYGTKSIATSDPITQDTIFEIGSITKVFTTLALTDMVREGRVTLDDPIEKYLPAITLPEKEGAKITLRHLATHTAGFRRSPDNNTDAKNSANPYADYTPEQLYAYLATTELSSKPGEMVAYSNLGVGLLGHILEVIEHKPYEDVIKDRILTKLGMDHTGVTLVPALQAQSASGHAMFKIVEDLILSTLTGAGALRSSVKDMSQFLAANMGIVAVDLCSVMQVCHQQQFSDAQGTVGFGWQIMPNGDDRIMWHNGGTGGYSSFIGFTERTNRGVVILNNSTDSVDDLGLHILAPERFKMPVAPVIAPELLRDDYLQKFVGKFELTEPNGTIIPVDVVHSKGKLFIVFEQVHNMQLLPIKENSFRVHGFSEEYMYNFIFDAAGNIVEVDMHEPGNVIKLYPKK